MCLFKRTIIIITVLSLVLCFASCSGGEKQNDTADTSLPAASATESVSSGTAETYLSGTVEAVFNGKYRKTLDFGDYIKLNGYKGLSVEYNGRAYDSFLAEVKALGDGVCEEKREGKVENGDTVVIDFKAYKDQNQTPFISDTDYIWNTGSGEFFDRLGLDLSGEEIGSEIKKTLKYPDDYFIEENRGVSAEFTIKIQYVKLFTHPAVDDDFIAKYTSGAFTTVESYAKHLYEQEKMQTVAGTCFDKLLEDVTSRGLSYDEEITVALKNDLKESDEALASQLNISPAAYRGMSDETYEKWLTDQAQTYFTRTVLMYAVASLESLLPVTDEEVRSYASENAKEKGLTPEAFLELYGEDNVKELILNKKTALYLAGVSHITDTASARTATD